MKEQKRFKDLEAFVEYIDEGKDVLNIGFIEKIDWDNGKFEKELEKMFIHMSNTLENITDYKVAKIEYDLINKKSKIVFIFEATNISFEDLRSYTILL